MATPRTIRLPGQANERGGLRLTSARDQGVEAVEQAVRMSLLPAGRCDNPWVSREAMSEDLVFSDPVRLRVDLIVRLRQAFAGHRVRDRAALLPGSERVAAVSGQPGRVVLSFSWRNLRSDEVQTQEVEVGP